MKKILSLMLAMILAFSVVGATVFATGSDPTFVVSEEEAAPGETVRVTISIENNPGIASIQLEPQYDSNVLEWTDVEQGDYTGTWNPRVDRGFVNWFGPSGHNVDFDGVFAVLVFTVKETAAAGDYTVTVTYDEDNVFDQYDENVTFAIQAGKVTVTGDNPPAGEPTFVISEEEAAPGETVRVTISIENNPGIASIQLEPQYDSNVLEWTDVEQGDYTGTWNPRVDRGFVNWFGPSGHNVDFDGVFATLVFTVKETAAAGDYTVTVTYDEDNVFDQYEENVTFAIQAGKVTVTAPEEAYYLIGTMTGWQVNEDYKFTLNEDADVEEYILNVPNLEVGDELKVVKAAGTVTSAWYPDGVDNNYVVDDAHSGNVNVYFRPAGNSDWESFHEGGFFYISALHTVTVETDGNGTASIDPEAPDYTAEVTLTVTPNKGYVYAYTEIYDGNGEQIDLGDVQWNDTALTFNMPDYDIVVKVYFKEGPAFRSQSLMLQGRIGVRFFMSLPENDAFEYERVDFTISGKNADRAAATVEFSEDLPKNSKGYYGFTFYVNTIQMADTITATFYYLDNGVERTISKEYSVKSYLEWFDRTYSANPSAFAPEMANVIKALADLGHYMQAFLDETNNDWSVEEGDHAEMDKFFTTYTEDDVADATAFVADHALSITGENSDIKGLQYALDLEREMAIRVFITVAEDFEGEFTATVDGKDAEVTKLTDTMYMVEVKDVQAHQLSREYTITIATAEGGTLTIVGSGLSYANLMFDTYSSNTLGEYAAVALYRYSQAADELKASAE